MERTFANAVARNRTVRCLSPTRIHYPIPIQLKAQLRQRRRLQQQLLPWMPIRDEKTDVERELIVEGTGIGTETEGNKWKLIFALILSLDSAISFNWLNALWNKCFIIYVSLSNTSNSFACLKLSNQDLDGWRHEKPLTTHINDSRKYAKHFSEQIQYEEIGRCCFIGSYFNCCLCRAK